MSVLVCSSDVRREVDGVAELDEVLDGLAAGGVPVLVELTGGDAVMNLGVGRHDAAVVMFRDADGRPWCARAGGGLAPASGQELVFAKNGKPYRFFADAAIAPTQMREAAREFVRTPGVKPSVLRWMREGLGANASDGGASGP